MSKIALGAMVRLTLARLEPVETILEALQGSPVVGVLLEQKEIFRWPDKSMRAGERFSLDSYVNRGWIGRAEMTGNGLGQFANVKRELPLGDGTVEGLL